MASIAKRVTQKRADGAGPIRRFFYDLEVPYGLAIVRILLPLALLGAHLPRWSHSRELYSTDGATTPLWIGYGYSDMLPEFSGAIAVGLHSILILLLVTSSLGWCSRISLWGATILYTYLNLLDAISTMTKYSVIASHGMLLLSLSQSGAVWSIDSLLTAARRKRQSPGEPAGRPPAFPAWPRRLVQILIGCVYFGAAMTKLHTPAFFSGHQLQTWMLTHLNAKHPFGESLAYYQAMLVIFAYITIVWEIVFIFLAWQGWGRRIMLGLGTLFHAMTYLVLGLDIFPLVCISIYFSFLNERDVRVFAYQFRRLKRRINVSRQRTAATRRPLRLPLPASARFPSAAVFAFSVLLVAVGGIEVERRIDPYGERRPEGPYTLRELSDEEVAEAFPARPDRLRDVDKIANFDLGSSLIGGVLAHPRREFQQGETLVAQCSFTPLHEDMWLECNLHDAQNRVVLRLGQVATRESLRCNYSLDLTESLVPGQYFMVLQNAGREILRKQFTLQPSRNAVLAN